METRRGTRCTGILRAAARRSRATSAASSQTANGPSPNDERAGSFAEGLETKPRDGFRATDGRRRRRAARA